MKKSILYLEHDLIWIIKLILSVQRYNMNLERTDSSKIICLYNCLRKHTGFFNTITVYNLKIMTIKINEYI